MKAQAILKQGSGTGSRGGAFPTRDRAQHSLPLPRGPGYGAFQEPVHAFPRASRARLCGLSFKSGFLLSRYLDADLVTYCRLETEPPAISRRSTRHA
jgi:hypothetical protein